MSDVFLTLAQTEKGLSCFIASGWLEDGSQNRLKIRRLKDKCGNKSNASSEVEFYDLYAAMLGERVGASERSSRSLILRVSILPSGLAA